MPVGSLDDIPQPLHQCIGVNGRGCLWNVYAIYKVGTNCAMVIAAKTIHKRTVACHPKIQKSNSGKPTNWATVYGNGLR